MLNIIWIGCGTISGAVEGNGFGDGGVLWLALIEQKSKSNIK